MARYIGIVDGEKGAYGITFPDLPGCTSMGETIDAVAKNAVEAVRMWVEDAIADGEPLPLARALDDLIGEADVSAALASGAVAVAVRIGEFLRPPELLRTQQRAHFRSLFQWEVGANREVF